MKDSGVYLCFQERSAKKEKLLMWNRKGITRMALERVKGIRPGTVTDPREEERDSPGAKQEREMSRDAGRVDDSVGLCGISCRFCFLCGA